MVQQKSPCHIRRQGDFCLPQLGEVQRDDRSCRLVDESVPQSQHRSFRAAGDVQLGENVADVGFDRGWTNHQLFGDLRVAQSFDEQGQHITFANAWVASGESVARPAYAARMVLATSSADTFLSK